MQNGGSIYARKGTSALNAARMRRLEEPLNHIFDIAFGIAPGLAINALLAKPLGIDDPGPFERLGREVADRYPDMQGGNTTQQDGFYVSEQSLIGVELKLGSKTSPGQVVKYIALLASEQRYSGRRRDLGLLYITPSTNADASFQQGKICPDGSLPTDFLSRVPKSQMNPRIENIIAQCEGEIADVIERLRISHISWAELVANIRQLAAEHTDASPGSETLHRLLSGLADAVEQQDGCAP